MPNPPIRLMVVDDSAVIRGLWTRILERDGDVQVVASAYNGRAALDILARKQVDVVLLDIEMPEMDGITALPRILELDPKVRVIMASSLTRKGAEVTLQALSLGAADYVAKPLASQGRSLLEEVAQDLLGKIRALGRRGPAPAGDPAPGPPGAGRSGFPAVGTPARAPSPSRSTPSGPPAPPVAPLPGAAVGGALPGERWASRQRPRILGVASSTGGPNALAEVLGELGTDYPLPVVVCQHMPPLFTTMLAERLETLSGRPTREPLDGEAVQDGHTYVAPGGKHMVVVREGGQVVLRLNDDPPENFCRPSADPLFRSLKEVYGGGVEVVVLTGMGHDGLAGVRELRAAGAGITVQDEETSVVWGMPGAVAREGLAHRILPLGGIAREIRSRAGAAV